MNILVTGGAGFTRPHRPRAYVLYLRFRKFKR